MIRLLAVLMLFCAGPCGEIPEDDHKGANGPDEYAMEDSIIEFIRCIP